MYILMSRNSFSYMRKNSNKSGLTLQKEVIN